jgi:hypothetical protein
MALHTPSTPLSPLCAGFASWASLERLVEGLCECVHGSSGSKTTVDNLKWNAVETLEFFWEVEYGPARKMGGSRDEQEEDLEDLKDAWRTLCPWHEIGDFDVDFGVLDAFLDGVEGVAGEALSYCMLFSLIHTFNELFFLE